ncbi:hypothetical protein AK812_SmicGene1019 [Symbiodinium microadriaticum]|uniref:Uncharacterized protein n=1 Tax=Symbiodinium microadriaticum TaxID=2951 RepID=A0A1Q9F522_SYMMI|nr:hypothetical protein AK812_SmicGene1019 [Symbiodinium microadriaticum]CAE7195337.1 unnamed protein product [Symbiodinium microadriaticum]
MTLQLIFSIRGFNRLTAFATGAAGGFAFTNPDVDNEVAARTHREWPELKQSVEEFFSEVEVGQQAEEELAAEGLLPAAQEADLDASLENILADHLQGSYGREDLFIKAAITDHVRSVFREIQSDSSNRTVLYANYKEEISRLTAVIRGESESLSANALVPKRREMEERRAKQFYQLYEQHKEQERAVTTKSEVPLLLEKHLASFNQADMREKQHLEELQRQHELLASNCLALHTRQRDALSNITAHCHAEKRQARRGCHNKQDELQQELARLKAQFARCQHLLQDIRHQRRHAEQHRLQRAKVWELMEAAMKAEQKKKDRHETIATRYAQGQAVLQAFATWMTDSYRFMETTLLDRQQRLAEELPEQRRFVEDLGRRKEEKKQAMSHLVGKMKQKFRDAAAEERVKGGEQKARNKKRKAEELQKQISESQEEYDWLDGQEKRLKTLPQLREKTTEESRTWAGDILYNRYFGVPWSTPAALEAPQQQASWFPSLRRLLPRSHSAAPSPRQKLFDLTARRVVLLLDSSWLGWQFLRTAWQLVLRIGLVVLWLLGAFLGSLVWAIQFLWLKLGHKLLALHRTDRGRLTCDSMAVVAAGAGAPFPIGTFALVSRPPEFDEVWVAAHGPVSGELLVRTTTDDGSEWMWAVVLPGAGQMVAPTAVGDNRRPPHGVGPNAVNWLCVPPNAQEKWRPSAAESMTLIRDATQLVAQLQMAGVGSYPVNAAGTAGKLEPVQLPVVTAATAPLVPVPPAAPGGVGGGGGPAVAALGLSGEVAVPSGQAPNVDLKALEAAVAQLQALSLKDRKGKKDRDKDRKESKKKKKKKGRKLRKKKKRRSSSSSSSSSRSRSRSSSSSSSSSGSSGRKPLRWKEDGKDRQVSYSDLAHVDGLKWKKKGDLVAFAAKHPGALTAHFLAGVYARLSKGSLSRTRQLREASVASWAHQFSGLSEIRDMKEVLTMAEVLDSVNRREIERAMDILCQRILAIQAAKFKGGSWEKAEAIELVSTQKSLASSGMLALTNA